MPASSHIISQHIIKSTNYLNKSNRNINSCRGVTRPPRGSKLTLLSKRTIDGYHPSNQFKNKNQSFDMKLGGFDGDDVIMEICR